MAEACFRCNAAFTFTRRKHHCRSCGNVVCANCSGKRVVLHASKTTKDTGADESVRVCDACFTAHCAKHLPRYVPHPRSRHAGGHMAAHKASHSSGGGGGGGGSDFAPQRSFYEASTSASASNSNPSSARHSTSAAFAPGATLDPLGNLVLQAETQPWVGDEALAGGGYGEAAQGWGTNITEAGGRWFSSFFFADPSAASAATAASSNAAMAAAASPNGGGSPHPAADGGSAAKPVLMINPNHIAEASNDPASLHRGPLSQSRFASQQQPLLTAESHKSFVLLLFNTYCCVNPLEEKIKLHVPDVLFHGLPRKHIDLLANEADIDEHLTRKCRAYLNHVIARVRSSRESWMQFMEGYEYVGEAENNHADSASSASPLSPSADDPLPTPYASPPPFLSYPSPPPPLCTGSMLITNFQTVFIPDYAVYIFWDHVLCVEERKRWHRKRAAVRRSVAKAREERAEQERRRRAAEAINGISSVAESPENEISLTGSRSPSPSASPGPDANGTGNALMHSVSLDQVAEVLATTAATPGAPANTASPMPIPTATAAPNGAAPNMQRSFSETNIADDPTSPLIVQPLVVTVDAALPASSASPEIIAAQNNNTAASSSGSLSPDGGVQVTLSPAAVSVSRAASPMPSLQTIALDQSPLGRTERNSSSPPPPPLSSSQFFNGPGSAGAASTSSLTTGSSPSMTGSRIFASYRNLSQLHLPHYRLYQQTKYADPSPSTAAAGSSDPPSVDEFDPLAFAPPLISVPLLALRKLRHFTFETKDTGFLELKTKFHHALLRFVLVSLVKAQRFSSFKNLTKCLEHYSTFAAPGAAGGSAALPPPLPAQNRSTSVAGGSASGAGSGAAGSSSISADDTEIKQKCFAFRHTWSSFLQQQQLSPRGSGRNSNGGDMAEALASSPCDPGWGLYDALREYRRLGLAPDPRSPAPLPFRVSSINQSYTFCPSYPRHLVVPLHVSDADLLALAHFRSKRRIPSLVWSGPFPRAPVLPMRAVEPLAPEGLVGSMRARRALILRAAQPLTGITGQRNAEDEAMLQHACAAVGADRLLIVDARPMANAIGQSALGAGYENPVWYTPRDGGPNYGKLYASFNCLSNGGSKTPVSPPVSLRETQIAFMNCENIHAVRKSHHMLEKLIQKSWEEDVELAGYMWAAGSRVWGNADTMQLTQPSTSEMNGAAELAPTPPLFAQLPFPSVHPSASTWLSSLHATGHFAHLSAILAGVNHVLSVLSQGIVVLIHCSDGWDRTSLLVSLSELCLDSYYRTIEGFIVLIEKEWLSFGHRFQDRLGHGHFSQECSPVFMQFLDCVWQIVSQFPTQFQFDSRLLLWISTQMYSGLYSTFFFNSEEERARNQCPERTRSCWTYVVQHLDEFVSPCYGVGWAHLLPTGPEGEPARPVGYEPLSHFASLPLYADPSTLYVDTRDLRFWTDMYLGACASAQGLAWVGNQVPSAGNGGQLVPLHAPAIFSPSPSPSLVGPGPQHTNASLDLNPIQLVTESRSKAEDLATLQDRLDEATVGAVVQGLVGEVEANSLRAELRALKHASAARERALRADFEVELERRVAEATRQAKETHVIRTHEHGLAASPPGAEDLDASQIGLLHNGTGALIENGSGESTPSASGRSAAATSFSPSRSSLSISIPALLRKVVTPLLHESEFKEKTAAVCSGGCHQNFHWMRRRHNCRVCGAVRCDDCAPKRSFLAIRPPQYHSGRGNQSTSAAPEEARIVDERMCNGCVEKIVRAHEQKINGNGSGGEQKVTTPIAMRPSATSTAGRSPGAGSSTVAASDLFTSSRGQVVPPASYPGSATLSWFASKALAPFQAGAAAAARRERMSQFEPRATTLPQTRPRAGSQPHLFGPEKTSSNGKETEDTAH